VMVHASLTSSCIELISTADRNIDIVRLSDCCDLQYYQVPRLWLVGYDESRQPLAPKQVRGCVRAIRSTGLS
jgi:hypothetical protein